MARENISKKWYLRVRVKFENEPTFEELEEEPSGMSWRLKNKMSLLKKVLVKKKKEVGFEDSEHRWDGGIEKLTRASLYS